MLYLEAEMENDVVKYQWSIHQNRQGPRLDSASKFCHKTLKYSSIFSVSDSNIVYDDTIAWKMQIGLFFSLQATAFSSQGVSQFILSYQSISGTPSLCNKARCVKSDLYMSYTCYYKKRSCNHKHYFFPKPTPTTLLINPNVVIQHTHLREHI